MVLIYRRWEDASNQITAQGCVESPEAGLIFSESARPAFGGKVSHSNDACFGFLNQHVVEKGGRVYDRSDLIDPCC